MVRNDEEVVKYVSSCNICGNIVFPCRNDNDLSNID